MGDNAANIKQIVDFCNCNEGTALRLLEAAHFNVSAAIERYFNEGLEAPGVKSGSQAVPAASALKKPTAPASSPSSGGGGGGGANAGWATELQDPANSGSALVNAGDGASIVARPTDGRQVKFHEADIGIGDHTLTEQMNPRAGVLQSLPSNVPHGEPSALSWTSPPDYTDAQRSPPRDSEGRVKRARPDGPLGSVDHGDPSQAVASKRGVQRASAASGQENDPMQLDTQALSTTSFYGGTTDFAQATTTYQDHGWGSTEGSSSSTNAVIRNTADGRTRRPPSPPPRRDAGAETLPDYDLERALQASLQDQGRGGSVEDDDPELAAAIQASMTDAGMMDSWISTGSAGFGSKDGRREPGKVPDHLAPLKRKDAPDWPTALAAPFESLRLFPLILQALYALEPIRRGFQTYEIDMLSTINDLSFFWTGVQAGRKSNAGGLGQWVSNDEKEKADVVQRLQVLFYFMDRTLRPFCMSSSVLEVLPQSLMTMNSGQPEPADLAMYTISSFFDAYRTALRAVAGRHTDNSEDWLANKLRIFDTYVSYGMPEPASGGDNAEQAEAELQMPTPQTNPLTTISSTHLELRHAAAVNDMPTAVLMALEDDGALVTVPAETLCVGIKRDPFRSSSVGEANHPGTDIRPWRVDKHFYADPFLWERRRGIPHGLGPQELEWLEDIKGRRDEIAKRREQRKWLAAPAGKDPMTMMDQSLAYLEGPGQELEDAIRKQTNQEAATKLRQMKDHLQSQLNMLDEVIASAEAKLAASQLERIQRFRDEYEGKPEWQNVRYDLRALLIQNGEAAWAYVQHSGQWFRVQDGQVHVTDEATALSDESGAPGGGVFFLAYVRAEDAADSTADSPPEPFLDAIEADNQEFEALLLSLPAGSPATERFDPSIALSTPSTARLGFQQPLALGGNDGMERGGGADVDGSDQGANVDAINLSGLLQDQHEQAQQQGSPSSVVVEIGLP